MDSINSFKGYGKVDEPDQAAFRRKTRKRLIILVVSSVVLVAVIIGAVVGVVVHKGKNNSSSDGPATELSPSASLKAVCSVTHYPDSCYSSISSIDASNVTDPELLFKLSLRVAIGELSKLLEYPSKLKEKTNDKQVKEALTVCEVVFDDALDWLNESYSAMEVGKEDKLLSSSKMDDLRTWLSASITDQEACLDALQELNSTHYENSTLLKDIQSAMKNSTEFLSNSLAIGTKILGLLNKFNMPIHRRRLLSDSGINSDFPSWVRAGDRRLLQETNPVPDATVAQDGSGDYRTIKEAVAAVPKKSPKRFVIYVKKGKYIENVVLDKSKWNVMMYGDGKTETIVSGELNFVDGTPTFATATVGK